MNRLGTAKLILKIMMGSVGIFVSAILIVAAIVLLDNFRIEVLPRPLPLVLGLVSVALTLAILIILDLNKKLKERLARSPVNLRWFIIIPLALAFGLVTLLVMFSQSRINFKDIEATDLNHEPTITFVIFFATFCLLEPAIFFLYFGIKNMKIKMRLHPVKFTAFSITSTATLCLLVMVAVTLLTPLSESGSRVVNGYEHDDGPWVTWYDDPKTSACITWLTKSRSSTILNLGLNPSDITDVKTGVGNVFLHKVYLTGLSPDTLYYYTIPGVNFEINHSSTVFSFRTAPATIRPFTFTVFGDKQPTSGSTIRHYNHVMAGAIINETRDFDVQLGDIADDGDYIEDWHTTLGSLTRHAANSPFMACVGNHDYGEKTGNFRDLFTYPYEPAVSGWYYSFDYLNAHFTVIDSMKMNDAQLAWIESDLATANSSGATWKFCLFHYTIITTGTSSSNWDLQTKLVPLFDKYGVDAVFYAHDHHYEYFNYTYGKGGLVHDPAHDWTHKPVSYFCSGGGGANLEAFGYGLLYKQPSNFTRTWYNLTAAAYQNITYNKYAWNESRYVDHSDVPGLITCPNGRNYYHDPSIEIYQEDILQYGYVYGEQAYHYILVEIDGNTCRMSTRYPDGSILAGPNGTNVQDFTIVK